jgi:hypothetical protein
MILNVIRIISITSFLLKIQSTMHKKDLCHSEISFRRKNPIKTMKSIKHYKLSTNFNDISEISACFPTSKKDSKKNHKS